MGVGLTLMSSTQLIYPWMDGGCQADGHISLRLQYWPVSLHLRIFLKKPSTQKHQSLWRFQNWLWIQEVPPAFHFDRQSTKTPEAGHPSTHLLIHPIVKQMHLPTSASPISCTLTSDAIKSIRRAMVVSDTGTVFSLLMSVSLPHIVYTCQLLKALLNPLQVFILLGNPKSNLIRAFQS